MSLRPRKLLVYTSNGHPVPNAPGDFVVTHLSCLPCGDRIEIDGVETDHLRLWVLLHGPHINAMENDGESRVEVVRQIWRSRR